MKLQNKTYDYLKWVCLIFLPAAATFYGLIASTLGWAYTKEILTIIGGLEAFLGSILGISCASYKGEGNELS